MNQVTLAVAGSRKTQSIVEACAGGPSGRRRLVITYTVTGQSELKSRLQTMCVPGSLPELVGWYSFMLQHFVRPFLPLKFQDRRLRGLNFEGEPAAGHYASGEDRFFDSESRAYKRHLSRLALDVSTASQGAVIDRLERIYDEIYVDEVQDLTGCDLHILDSLMASKIDVHMVGDVRQSVFNTNPQDPNLKQYRGLSMAKWFEEREAKGTLKVEYSVQTWRSNQLIADFSDSIFSADHSFPSTVSMQCDTSLHDGIFVISTDDVDAYIATFSPVCLRDTKRTAADVELPFMNFGTVKGLTVDRVLIFPNSTISAFVCEGTALKPKTACGLYIGVTRARFSVAFVVDDPTKSHLPRWEP